VLDPSRITGACPMHKQKVCSLFRVNNKLEEKLMFMPKRWFSSVLFGAVLVSGALPAYALEAGDWLVRGRIINVRPNDDSGALFVGATPLAGSGVEVDSGYTLDLDFTYMLSKHIGAELLLDLSSEHKISSAGTLSAIAPGEIIETRVLPPTLLLQYHFLPDARFRPYVGAGINYTLFFSEKATSGGRTAAGLSGVKLDSSVGFALQLGADYDINKDWFINADIKYIDIETTAKMSSALGPLRVDADVNPLVFGLGIGMRF